jgi:hypothetical protein
MERLLCLNSRSIMEAHDPVSDPSVKLEHTTSVKPLKLDIPDQAIQEVSELLERKIVPEDPNDMFLWEIWLFVYATLSRCPELSGVIANREEYDDNVKRQGEEEFLELVRDSARRNSWRDLLRNGIFPPLKNKSFFILSVQTCL